MRAHSSTSAAAQQQAFKAQLRARKCETHLLPRCSNVGSETLVCEKEVEHMTKGVAAASALVAMIGSAVPAWAQGGLSAAVLELARNAPPGVVRPISGEGLYGAVVCARIIDENRSAKDLAGEASVAFTTVPRGAVTTPGVCPPSAGLEFVAPGNPDPS